jgi:L-arabinonolactonase
VEISQVGEFTLGWGESLIWDERRQRLYFVDCLASTIHWIDHGSAELHSLRTPSMPTGLVPTDDGRLVVVLEDGLYLANIEEAALELLSSFPEEIGGRCNDICADLDGNLITGKLNLGPAEGSAWWYSVTKGWRLVDSDIANTNGPAVAELDGEMTLVIGDTSEHYYAYPYDSQTGAVGDRRVFGDMTNLAGRPDGSTFDSDGGLWCALVEGGQLARFTTSGLDQTFTLSVQNPTDLTFAGPDLDSLYVVSTSGSDELAGALLRIDGLQHVGRLEPRFTVT